MHREVCIFHVSAFFVSKFLRGRNTALTCIPGVFHTDILAHFTDAYVPPHSQSE